MTAKPCKHPRLDKQLRCKSCGLLVDIREKKNKYHAKRTDGFHSGHEARRAKALMQLERIGKITGLQFQVKYELWVGEYLICCYRADFVYADEDGKGVVEDAKPNGKRFKKTEAYRIFVIKKNLMKACHNIEIQEI